MTKANIMTIDERHTLLLSMLALRLNAKNAEEYIRADRVIQAILQEAELATNSTNQATGCGLQATGFQSQTIEK